MSLRERRFLRPILSFNHMKRSQRLNTILLLANEAERQAAEAYQLVNKVLLEEVQKYQDLCDYYTEYEAFFNRSHSLVNACDISRQRSFLIQLTDAKLQQNQVIFQRRTLVESKKIIWQKAHLKRLAMADLIQRIKADEDRALSKKEEKMLDEWYLQSSSTNENRSRL